MIRGLDSVEIIEEIGSVMAAERGLRRGDRVAVDCFSAVWKPLILPEAGEGALRARQGRSYSMIQMRMASGLRGRLSTHILATGPTVLYPCSHMPPSRLPRCSIRSEPASSGLST